MTSTNFRVLGVLCCALALGAVAAPEPKGKDAKPATATLAVPPTDAFGPYPSPHDSRNVVFVYDTAKIYTLLAQAGQIMHVEFAPDEQIVTIQMSDPVRWTISRVENASIAPRIFFKTAHTGVATTVSVVMTTGRKYELLLQSMPEGSYRYQHVAWRYPDVEARQEVERAARVEAVVTERKRLETQELSATLAPEQLNWNYEVEGKAAFRPDAVFDDGRFTYLTMPRNVQEVPAVFLLDGKSMQVVDYLRQGPYLVVQRLVDGLLLKLDDREVRVKRRGAAPERRASFFGW